MLPKTKGHIFVLLAFLVLLGMIVSPVCAAGNYTPTGNLDFWTTTTRESFSGSYSYQYAAPTGEKISLIQFTVDTGQRVDFTLYYGGNKTVSGSAENSVTSIGLCGFLPCPMTTSIVTLNGVSKSYTYGDVQPLFDFDIAGYGRDNDNQQTGFLVYDGQYGNYDNDLAVFFPVANTGGNLIDRVDISGTQTFSLYVDHGKAKDVAGLVQTGVLDTINQWVSFALAMGGAVLGFALMTMGLIKFFFIDNLLLVVALWIGVTMAYSAISTKGDIFKFYTKFFKLQKALYGFIMEMWNYLVQIIASFRGIFRL